MEKRYLDDKYYEFSAIQDNTIIKYRFDEAIERIDKSDNFYIHLKNTYSQIIMVRLLE